MHCFVTGCAGFIGSHLTDRLLALGHTVSGCDNFSTGQPEFLASARAHPRFCFHQLDLLDLPALTEAMRGAETVFHFAANADVRFGLQHPRRDLEQNTIATFHVLEAMRASGARRLAFPSTGSVYGETPVIPTPEDAPFPIQTSLYAASKLAGEGLIAAYCAGFGLEACIFRFVSILGERYTHGHVFDFYRQLRAHPERLDVLGDGTQRKSYLYIGDCLDAILLATEKMAVPVSVFNLGTPEYCTVRESIAVLCGHLGLSPRLVFSGGGRGWVGDNPFIFLDTRRIQALGWTPRLTIREGLLATLRYLQSAPWLLERRP